ncbi:MAG: amino acid ABC transporter permease [Jannaschia helgolandensis]|jgi:glutamate/aspartate transport system permease protein|uniref:L-glutamate ABC transporter membrane protein /L-aspartate ABC transporter membrane protein n=1 Tax=Jannaschia helgolandensis TaxID=188906 RepID=A0A1H7QL04_9RHOB|nr:amino acid ABC transporter permease [Jannaschia helgolandensis]SEL48642.1 L-glutamate ABC transporter membrane protein /L-aspartate ABC transporter membrane protein [Jannaschia helgolandensis]|tara:strand:- start:955 stop:1674 length:720 start_codon:yes stop_codon:yes gene_type:complete
MNYNWNWAVLFEEQYLSWLISGFGWTVSVALSAWCIALVIGALVGVGKTVPNRVIRAVSATYVEIFRNVPLLVQMFIWYFAVPELLPDDWGRWMKRDMPNPEFVTAVIALALYTASRIAEQVRAGIETVPPGLTSAATAHGLSVSQTYRYVLLPISFRMIVPPLTSEFLTVFKNSSLALTIGLLELTAQSQQIAEYTFQGFEAFTAATVIYVCIALVATGLMQLLEKYTRIPGYVGTEG